MRKFLTSLLGLVLFMAPTFAQTIEVTGKVINWEGAPIPGATIKVKGTKTGTSAASDGTFKISAPSKSTLQISAVGFETLEVNALPNVNVSLKQAKSELTEVVVTALGIRREKKALGYSVATVGKKDLELRPDGDVVRLLSGKAPGVDILNTSGISGSGTNIIIRGVSTISGNSTPLFIVDGVPFDASTNAQANFVYGNTTTSRFLDLDPNNVESISVLKGLSATTLYGELGRNGVVLVTTKNGANKRVNKKTEITVTQSLFQNKVSNLPDYQNNYGGGFDQSLGLVFFSNWGAKFTDPPTLIKHPYDKTSLNADFPQFKGASYEYKAYNSVERFFRTGTIKTTSINVAASGNNTNFNANYSYLDDEGFTPGNRLIKNTFGIGGTSKLNNNVTVAGTFNYAITDFKSPPTSTSFGSNPSTSSVFGNLIYTPRAVDLIGLPWESPLDHRSVYYRNSNDIQNPFWTVNNSFTGQKVNRVFGNFQIKYEVLKNLNISYRVGYDNYSDYNYLSQNRGGTVGGNDYRLGLRRTVNGFNTIWNHDVIINWQKQLATDWNITVDAGANSQERIYTQNGIRSTNQLVYGLFNHANFVNHDNFAEDGSNIEFQSRTQAIGVYAQGSLSFKDYLYITAGGRNSWTSNLEKDNRKKFYPSASISFIPTSAIAALSKSKGINYLKLRAGYATSANFGSPYRTRPSLSLAPNSFVDRSGTVINAVALGNRLANKDLKPELLKEIEVGLEGKFIDNRLSLDLTFYKRTSTDQILRRDLDPASGYTAQDVNAGNVRNKGIELGLGYTVIRNKDWRWQLDVNYTLNRSLVYGLPDYIKQIVIDGFTNQGLFALNGQPLGVIQSTYTTKDPKTGQRLTDDNGYYILSNDIGIVGDPTPLYKVTGISTLGYKGFSFRMQWDFTKGGQMLALTPSTLVGRGLTKDTDFDRLQSWVLPGINENTGKPNDIQISTSEAYFNNFGFSGDDLRTYDATVIRLREASLSYSLPENLVKKTPFGSVQFTVSGQNLWYKAPNFPKYVNFDPETSSLGVSNVRGLEYLTGPTSRRIGASLRVTF